MNRIIARPILLGLRPYQRAVMYVIATIYLSIFCDFSKSSNSYFAQQNNIFNLYFVKLSWGWTLVSLGLCLLVNSMNKREDEFESTIQIKRSLKMFIRLLIATAVWYYGVNFFLIIEEGTGVCVVPKYLDKNTCKRNGFLWNGFDISGHCFLLVWCNLVISEEIQASYSTKKEKVAKPEKEITSIVENNKKSWNVDFLFYFLALLTVIWDVMIICTNMFFHTTSEKFLGTIIAVSSWAALYQFVYKTYFSNFLSLR